MLRIDVSNWIKIFLKSKTQFGWVTIQAAV